jgi:hypothetical protein
VSVVTSSLSGTGFQPVFVRTRTSRFRRVQRSTGSENPCHHSCPNRHFDRLARSDRLVDRRHPGNLDRFNRRGKHQRQRREHHCHRRFALATLGQARRDHRATLRVQTLVVTGIPFAELALTLGVGLRWAWAKHISSCIGQLARGLHAILPDAPIVPASAIKSPRGDLRGRRRSDWQRESACPHNENACWYNEIRSPHNESPERPNETMSRHNKSPPSHNETPLVHNETPSSHNVNPLPHNETPRGHNETTW